MRIGGELISADSGAVYRGMDIGTAKPGPDERRGVRFHLIDVASPADGFSVAEFKSLALEALAGVRARGAWPIVCGGTGLYVRALLDNLNLTETGRDAALREQLYAEAEASGSAALHARLAERDPAAAARIHVNDRVRIVRSLEIMACTGRTVTELHAEDARVREPLHAVRYGLTGDRGWLHARIDARVDAMMRDGLLAEVRALLDRGVPPDAPGMGVLGYREMVAHAQGEIGLDEAVEQTKRNTRRYARRQLTWFRADRALTWIDVTAADAADAAVRIAGDVSTL